LNISPFDFLKIQNDFDISKLFYHQNWSKKKSPQSTGVRVNEPASRGEIKMKVSKPMGVV
jgi:hypothetical protein